MHYAIMFCSTTVAGVLLPAFARWLRMKNSVSVCLCVKSECIMNSISLSQACLRHHTHPICTYKRNVHTSKTLADRSEEIVSITIFISPAARYLLHINLPFFFLFIFVSSCFNSIPFNKHTAQWKTLNKKRMLKRK